MIRLLGPFEITVAGRPVGLTGQLRTLLAVLAMAAGRTVTTDRLVSALWPDDPPVNGRRSVQTYVTRLRQMLGAGLIATTPTGYQLTVEPDEVDALRFTRLLDQAAAEPARELERLTQALEEWRGVPFDGTRSTWLEDVEGPRLVERYLLAVERRADLDVAEGQGSERLAELNELTARYPLRESLWARLLVVLDRSGRPAEALSQYAVLRGRLADELGVEPGAELQQIHGDLLAGRRPMTSSAPAGRTPRRPVPQQLPADIDTFAGRHSHLKELTGALRASVVVVHGPAGVGKTALAVHWAHSVRKHFRDGQLYVDLRGYGPAGSALEVGDAVRGFLDALGVPAHQLPSTLPAQLTLYRSLVADKNVLVVLDNARDEQQARALLPGGSPGLALVTSRNQLTGLIAAESARPIGLGVLTDDEARQFFAMRVGHDRVAAEEKAVDDVIALCGRLPLALAIASARSVTNPTFSFAALADELRATDGTLDAFVAGDPTVDVRAVFSWSLRALSGDAAAVFRTLAAHPGPDLTIPAAASLAGLPARRLRLILRELSRANLLGERVPGRFVMHDLVRAYAAELDTGTNARTAQRRLLDHYVRTAQHAVRLLDPGQHFADVPPEPGVVPETPADPAAAVGWLTAEYPNLLAAVRFASRERFQTHTWDLAVTLWVYLDQQARWHDMINTETAALAAVRALTDGAKQAAVHHGLGYIYLELDRYDEARHELRTALDLFEAAGEPAEQASVLITLAYVPGDGVRHAQEALELFRSIGDVAGAANALHTLATLYRRAGELDRALAHGHEALAVLDGTDHDRVLAKTLRTVGDIHQDRGEYADAIEWYERALDLQRRLGLRYSVADTLAHLGDTYRGMEDLDDARSAWREAVAVLDDLGHPSADDVRAKLR